MIHPWVDNPNNTLRPANHVRPVRIPDVCASELLQDSKVDFSMKAGEFLSVYREDTGDTMLPLGPSVPWPLSSFFFVSTFSVPLLFMD